MSTKGRSSGDAGIKDLKKGRKTHIIKAREEKKKSRKVVLIKAAK